TIIVKDRAINKNREIWYLIYITSYIKATKIQVKSILNTLKILRNKDILV
ncbi:uncharacterized protein K444DRAFT_545745, partial [Hyaloscypha bicolor E]